MFIGTAILQIVFLVLAIHGSENGNVAQTMLFCSLMICEEISGQHQQDRREDDHERE